MSSVWMALQRLVTGGWLESRREGQAIRYDLRPGVRSFVKGERTDAEGGAIGRHRDPAGTP